LQHVIVDGGLDLVRAAPAALPGSIRECLNYEVGFSRGLARIDGLERFDGQTNPSSTNAWRYYMPNADITGTFTPVETLTWTKDDRTSESGVLVQVEDAGTHKGLFIVFRATTSVPPDGATITGDTSGASFVVDTATQDIRKITDYYATHQDYLAALDSFAGTLRTEVDPVPGTGSVVGMHFHEDKLYAVRDSRVFTFTDDSTDWAPKVGGFLISPTSQLGEIVDYDPDTDTLSVHAMTADGFDVSATDNCTAALAIRFEDGDGTVDVGDDVSGDTSSYAAVVRFIEVRNGAFDSGNAEGVMLLESQVTLTDGEFTAAENVTNDEAGKTGSFTAEEIFEPYLQDVLTVGTVATQAETASLWESSTTGWQKAWVGRRVDIDNGTTDPTTAAATPANTGNKLPTITSIPTPRSYRIDWTGTASANDPTPFETDDAGVTNMGTSWARSTYSRKQSETVHLNGFKTQLRNEDVVTGIEVVINAKANTIGADDGGTLYILHKAPSGQYIRATVRVDNTGGYNDYTVGGQNSKWGENLTPELVNSVDFKFFMYARGHFCDIDINCVKVIVYYNTNTAEQRLYVYDTATTSDVGWIQVRKANLSTGAWDGTGEGYLQLFDWSSPNFNVGMRIMTGAGNTGNLIGILTSDINFPLLPGSKLLEDNASRYQFISYNFFASEELNAIYGVSGAGRAFYYNGQTLDFIDTGVGEERDKPRHVAAHQTRLALGFAWGEVYVSSVDDPLSFDPITLASTHGFGDRVTGLLPLNGIAMAVFTESSIGVLHGAALDSDGAGIRQEVISPNSGAIEYTVQNIGNRPIYADFRGISTLDALEQYGDFGTRPLSYDVTPWLVGRLQRKSGVETTDEKVVHSVVVRNKNQYRLFFADGYVLTCTLVGQEIQPQNTIQRYWLGGTTNKYMKVFATASGVTTGGQDRVFVSAEDRFDVDMSAEASYVYELDRGNSFDGFEIQAFFTCSYHFGEAPYAAHKWNIVHMHGKAAGAASLKISRAVNYEELDNPVMPYEPAPFGSLEHVPSDQGRAYYAKCRLSGRGFAVSLSVDHQSATEFPHIIQMFTFVDDQPIRINR